MRRSLVLMSSMLILSLWFAVKPAEVLALYDDVKFLPEKSEWVPDIGGNVAFMTKYIWRGQLLDDEPVMEFDTNISKWGFTMDMWGNYSLNNDKDKNFGKYEELTELDYTASYGFNVGEMGDKLGVETPEIVDPFGFSGGYIFYTFPNLDFKEKGSYTHEVFAGCSYDIFLQPFFRWYWDVEAARGSYLQFGGSHTFDLGKGITASLGTSFGYNHQQWTDKVGWSDMLLSANVSVPVLKYFTVTPSLAYSVILDKDTYNDVQDNEFYGGTTVAFTY